MIYEGAQINNITLTPGEMTTVEYSGFWGGSNIFNYGPGDIYVNWAGDAVIGSGTSLLLKKNVGYSIEIYPAYPSALKLNMISDDEAVVQVVRRAR